MSFSISRSSQTSIRSSHKITSFDLIKPQSYKLRARGSPKTKSRHAILFGVHRVPKTHFFTFYKRFFKLFTLVLTPQTKFGFSALFLIRFLRYFSFCFRFSAANFIKICAKTAKNTFFHLYSLVHFSIFYHLLF